MLPIMVLKSDHYDDVYFSAQDGLAETSYVFLDGNNLPAAFNDIDRFTIAETGFGTGLNFLAAWDLFEKYKKPGQSLKFISVEKHPLQKNIIEQELEQWSDQIGLQLKVMLDMYPERPESQTDIFLNVNSDVSLHIMIGDAAARLSQADFTADCWFLDGFSPAVNPDMWTDEIFAQVSRLSASHTTLASFTAAGFVRRGLIEAGFDISKRRGFGRKRDMIIGHKATEDNT